MIEIPLQIVSFYNGISCDHGRGTELGTEIEMAPGAGAEMVVREAHIDQSSALCLAAGNFIDVDRITTADQEIAFDRYVLDGSPIIVEHYRRRLIALVDDGVAEDFEIGKSAVRLDPVVMRLGSAVHAVNEIVLDDRVVSAHVNSIGAIVYVVAQECTLACDALASGALVVDLTILNDGAGHARLDKNDDVTFCRGLAIAQSDI